MKVDYIIVGLGLAGLAFAEHLKQANKSFVVFEDGSQKASKVAAGVYNPVILKRFSPVWDAADQLSLALPFYRQLEVDLNVKIDQPLEIIRPFSSIEEQNDWFTAADKPFFEAYMSTEVLRLKNPYLNAPYGCGKLVNTGLIDTDLLLKTYASRLLNDGLLFAERFNYQALKMDTNGLTYQEITAKQAVCCEGFGLLQNPYFNQVPLKEAKGELLIIHAPKLNLSYLLKAGVFILPLGNDLYKIGATFNWHDKSQAPTEAGRLELLQKFEKICTVPYTVVDHLAGIRPTVKDRRPVLGKHPRHPNLAILNGFGTRGVMLAPKMAQLLFNHLERNTALPSEVSLARFI